MSVFKGVADTLFIPLAARIFVSKKYPEYFYDRKALSLEEHMPDDTILKKSSEYSLMASVARYYNMDSMVKNFIAQKGACNIVYLGAGLETAYFRLNEPSAVFYEIDLPGIIDVRRAVLGEYANEILIGCDIFDMSWAKKIKARLPSLLIASGVFQYFNENAVLNFINNVRAAFKSCELIFDATNETGIRYANKYVKKTGNSGAVMNFYINDAEEFAKKSATVLTEQRVFFTDARKMLAGRLKLYTRIAMKIVDAKKRAFILRLKI